MDKKTEAILRRKYNSFSKSVMRSSEVPKTFEWFCAKEKAEGRLT